MVLTALYHLVLYPAKVELCFDRTVSFGIVSGKGRTLNFPMGNTPLLNDFIQTDAAIDPGSE